MNMSEPRLYWHARPRIFRWLIAACWALALLGLAVLVTGWLHSLGNASEIDVPHVVLDSVSDAVAEVLERLTRRVLRKPR